jgi:ribosomal protein S18 acetylase RimI-like enzyme
MWTITDDFHEYAQAAEAFLLADPVGNTVPLTTLADLRAGMPVEGARFGWYTSGGAVRGAFFHTPPHPVGLACMPVETVEPLVEALGTDIPAIVGQVALTDAAVKLIGPPTRVLSERLYRLGSPNFPDTPGHGRLAVAGDFPLLVSWYHAFSEEVSLGVGDDHVLNVQRRLAAGQLFVWEADGVPVSLAALSYAVGGVCRIGPVYTPPSCRRRGYGAAVTAFAGRAGLEGRCEQVVLFADLANPTSNSVYRSIGFEPVADYAHVVFHALHALHAIRALHARRGG